mgnify:FL=1|tara:strand:- start:57 stop:386 length:330 start_codon:yes stop_codon:yes gene_type:complete
MADIPEWLEKAENDTTQISLFNAMARRTDPDTSHIAALTVDANRLEKLVVSALTQYPNGCTVKEISVILDIDKWSISPRMKPLEGKGLVERTTERRDRSIVWRIADEEE